MQTLKYPAMVDALKAVDEPVIVVVDSFVGELRDVGMKLAADAGITPHFPRLDFGPSQEMMDKRRRQLFSKGGKPVMFIDQYPLAIHWGSGFTCFSLTDTRQEEIHAEIQAQNDYVKSAPDKVEWQRRADEVMAKTMAPLNNFISAQKEELAEIEMQAAELEKNGTSEQQQAFLDDLKQAEGGFMQRVIHRGLNRK